MSAEDVQREVVELLNDASASTNKLLATLNSSALLACIHFCSAGSSPNLMQKTDSCVAGGILLNPLFWFAVGLTSILITAAANYFTWLLLHKRLQKNTDGEQSKCLFRIATISAVLSAISFLAGVWIVVISI